MVERAVTFDALNSERYKEATRIAIGKIGPIIGFPVLQHGTAALLENIRQYFQHGLVSPSYAEEHGLTCPIPHHMSNKAVVYLRFHTPVESTDFGFAAQRTNGWEEKIPIVLLVDPHIRSKLAVPWRQENDRRTPSGIRYDLLVPEKVPPELLWGIVVEDHLATDPIDRERLRLETKREYESRLSGLNEVAGHQGEKLQQHKKIRACLGPDDFTKMRLKWEKHWWDDLTRALGTAGFLNLVQSKGNHLFRNTPPFYALIDGRLYFVYLPFQIKDISYSEKEALDFCRLIISFGAIGSFNENWGHSESPFSWKSVGEIKEILGQSAANPIVKKWLNELEDQARKYKSLRREVEVIRQTISTLFPGFFDRMRGKRSGFEEMLQERFQGTLNHIVGVMAQYPEVAVPIYDQFGNLHWPQKMNFQEIAGKYSQ